MIGTTIQNYTVQSLLGEGGMGKVYLATDNLLGRIVAIKNLNAQFTNQPQFLERFKNEAKTLARLSHPNIALLYNYLQNNGDYFMVMEYVEGSNLDQLLKKYHSLPYQIVVPLILQALQGLEHAHRKGILHRDLKPSNLMLTADNHVKLMDFGIAKVSDAAKLTQASRVIGTIEFLAPELIEGKEPSVASDIYSMGVTLYELLTGKLPFTGKSDYMLMQEIIKETPVTLQKLNATVPKALSDIVLKALEKKQEKRFLNATEFSQALAHSFPLLKEVDVSVLLQKKEPPPTVVQQFEKNGRATVLQRTPSAAPTKIVNVAPGKNNWQQISSNRKLYLIVASIVLAAILAFFLWPKPVVPAIDRQIPDPSTAVTDDNTNSNLPADPSPSGVNQDSISHIINSDENAAPPPDDPEIKPGKSYEGNTVKEKENPQKPNEKKPQPAKPQVQEDKPQPEPPPKPEPEPEHEVALSGPVNLRTSAILSLRENITPETAQDGQPVSFKVHEAVEMKGQVVLPAGAVIYGNIKKIGRMRMDITFHSASVRGRSLRLQGSESSGNIKQILSPGNRFKMGLRGSLAP